MTLLQTLQSLRQLQFDYDNGYINLCERQALTGVLTSKYLISMRDNCKKVNPK